MDILYYITVSSLNMIFYIFVSFGFFVGIILMVAPKAFETLNEALEREYGIRKRFIPGVEDTKVRILDNICRKYAVISGMMISIASFILLIIYR